MPAPKQPQDRKPKAAAKADAEAKTITVDFHGDTYTIEREQADNLELMEFVEDEQYIKAIRGYLGKDQWAKFKDANRDDQDRVNADAFEPFLNAVMVAIGGGTTEAPNSEASSGS